jgi:hypothetical protein
MTVDSANGTSKLLYQLMDHAGLYFGRTDVCELDPLADVAGCIDDAHLVQSHEISGSVHGQVSV